MKKITTVIALTFLLGFAVLWLGIDLKLWRFTPDPAHPKLDLSTPVVSTAGLLASTVGAGTAAVLGITISKLATGPTSLSSKVNRAVGESPLLAFGVLLYFFVGVATLGVWLLNPDEAPQVIETFALGGLGWGVGAFSSVFQGKT
jgi:hypothetical protein